MDPSNTTDDLFAGMKKKSKKSSSKKVNFDQLDLDAASPAPGQVEQSTEVTTASVPDTPSASQTNTTTTTTASDDLDFSDLKKKKKTKKTVRIASDDELEDDEPRQQSIRKTDKLGNEIIEDDNNDNQPRRSALSSTSSTTTTTNDEASNTGSNDLGLDEFADLKKKKKKSGSKKSNFDMEAFEKELALQESSEQSQTNSNSQTPLNGSDDDEEQVDDNEVDTPQGENPFGSTADNDEQQLSKAEAAAQAKAWLNEDRDYHYTELLGRFFSLLYQSHPSLSGGTNKKKYTIPPPQLFREGNKRSIFANVADICKRMHRQPEHVIQFLFAELGTNGSVDGSGRLVIKGRFQQKQIENVLRRYIVEYVTCKTCKSPDTVLTKDNRLFFMTCSSCGSTRSVQTIKTGFVAQTAKRRVLRAAANP
ncbi:translation initiation factor eIF-2 beta subunit [Microbotryomycetes sp. JL221]|nr:translation initiation factor eIF-2 beta subunit [Microbotryomycetes sp. JL221]